MKNSLFMTIKGSTQGLITEGAFTPESVGNVYQNGHENEIAIKSFDYGTATLINMLGQIAGQRSHNH